MPLEGRAVTVVGAGIGGLAAALALARRGAAVTVLEQAPAIAEVGAGIQIAPNGATVLRALGLGDALDRAGLRARAVVLADGRDGAPVVRLPLAGKGDWRFLHRADLIALLLDAARTAGVTLRTAARVAAADLSSGGAVLRLADGGSLRADLAIGADGLHSVVRATLNGPARARFTGHVAWRATIPEPPGAEPVAEVHMGPGRHLVTYPLRGGRLRNLVAVEERRGWVEESWSLRDDPPALRLAFADFGPRVRGWLAQVDALWLWGLFRHPVAPVWGRAACGGALAILGDAAHPTLPFLAQGANMALEDAWVLAACLDAGPDDAAALAAYQAARAARCARIVAAAAGNARLYHLRGPLRDAVHLGMRAVAAVAPEVLTGRFDWIHRLDVTAASA